ncbi:GBS Bsp-like repeat-containing protein, partial [Streptococcus urinalis]
YQADATGKAFIPFTNHKGYGDYRIDTYSFENGSHGLKSSTVTIPNPSAKVSVQQTDSTHYQVTVTETPQYITLYQSGHLQMVRMILNGRKLQNKEMGLIQH